jgi:SOS response regulatory protein OraA/RecX
MGLTFQVKKNQPQVLVLLWDGELWKEVSKSLFLSDLKKIANEENWEKFLSSFQLLEEKIAKKYAIALLAKKAYLSSALHTKLVAKGLSSQAAKVATDWCVQKGYLNDEQAIARLIAKEQRKGLAAKAIYLKLRQHKKLDAQVLRQGLEQAAISDEAALEQWLKRHAKKIDQQDALSRKKLMAKLIRLGFSAEHVFSRFNRLFEE